MVKAGGSEILIDIDPRVTVSHAEVGAWVRRAAVAVSGYLGHFPVKHLLVRVHRGGGGAVGGGVTHGDSLIDVRLGRSARNADLERDWIMTHEMFHLAFPTLERRYLWMMEGLSDYLEPVARARAGQLRAEDVWRELVEGLPQGLPGPDDRGLDNTPTWARTYWGGDLFWLLADVRIHVRTHNHRGVEDAIRAILADGGNGGVNWPLEKVLAVGDRATGVPVLKELHDELGNQPGHVDLDALWRQLGVKYNDGAVSFDDTAPWAAVRVAITAARRAKTR